jgi:RNA polymerase sigma-70 factor (ECF subfamily)
VALHRAVALAEVAGAEAAIIEVRKLSGLAKNQYYHAILGDLYQRNQQPESARQHYRQAIDLTPSTAEIKLLTHKLSRL